MSGDDPKRELLVPRVQPFGLQGIVRGFIATIYGLMTLVYVPIWFVIGFFIWPIPGLAHAFVHWIIGIFLECFLICFGIKVEVDGEEHVDPDQTYVIAANHRSWLDAAALIVTAKISKGKLGGRRIYFIIKRSLTYIPGFGLYMLWARYIPVDRNQKRKGSGSKRGKRDNSARIEAAVEHLQKGKSILIFAEGTRSPTHQFQKFRRGAAEMALRADVPILPVVFSGTAEHYPKGGTYIRGPGRIRMEILPPISPEGHERESLTQAAYDAISERYRLSVDGPPVGEDEEVLHLVAPNHTRVRSSST